METADSSWQDGGLGVSGFVRFLLRIAVHREESAGRAKAATVTLTRSLKELIGSHLQRAKCSEDDQFTMSLQTGKVQHLREIWEPLSRKIFQLYAEQGHVGEELRMGEDSLVLLLTDAGVLGGCLSEAGARQMCRSLLPRRHFRGGPRSFCFRGHAEVRRRRPRSPSLPPKVEGRQPYYAELGRSEGLYFEDFQEILLGLAMYHNPNLVVPIELRFEQFLMAMMEGLKRCILPLPEELDKEMPEHLKVQVNRAEEWDARQRAWDEMQEALQGCAEVPTEGWNKAEREARRRSFQDTAAASLAERRSLSAPPGLSLRSRFQKVARKELAVVSAMASAASEASEGKAGLGHPAGHRLETMKSIMKAAKRLGTDINVAELQRKRAEVGRQAMQRRRSSAMVKVKFLADRRRSVEARASNVPSAAPSNQFAGMLHTATSIEAPQTWAGPVHPRWHSVEVVTCVTGGKDVVVADFPMYRLFRATTPLPVHNVCEDVKWEGIDFRLRKYKEFFQDVLYFVVDGLDVFFNDVTEATAPSGPVTARVIARRYEELAAPPRAIVMSTERLCGWGGARFCSQEDEARYPEAPTDSKYLNAGGYVGPAEELLEMLSAVLHMKSTAVGEHYEKGQLSDQYFFKLYFWDHQDRIALDYHQKIFGNFLEISNRPCDTDWAPTCAVKPCCTESDNFRRFHELFYERFTVKACAVWREDNLPVSWHGNGAGKWLYLLALDQLSLNCGPAANVTRAQMPEQMMADLFHKYEARAQSEGDNWPGGFLTSVATHLEEPSDEIPQCRT
ncbi:unnamed protein product [Effrenium voratum]|uniref:PLOD1-3-like GT domain-containing protein n=1 Tax=Effrenium voratum TaxID=2562239 RepID=A0AA36N1C3_9DINO|nr:unnamed protein product [Effrenium voratum]